MQKTITTIWVLTACFLTLTATNKQLSDFTYLRSEGVIPNQLLNVLSSNEDEALLIQNLVKNGRLLYGTELNGYIETVADNLLENKPELRKELSIYIVRSPSVNAMVSRQGIVLVNLGLLAQITNESEFAFILGHEISHYVENKGKKKKQVKISSLSSYLNYHLNSREEELEADKLSLERYFKDSPYSTTALENIFDVFRYSYLPFNEIPYTRAEVETDFYSFPEDYFLANVKEIRSRADYVDTLSTHPNLQRRQQQLERFTERNIDNGHKFVQDESLFFRVRNLARLECINFFLTWHDYANAITNILVLKKQLGENAFLDAAEAAAYYGFHKHKTNGNIQNVVETYKDIEGEKQQVCYFLRKLNKKEANVLAIRKLIFAYKKYPDNDFLYQMAADAIYDLVKENKMGLQDFADFAQSANPDSISATLNNVQVVEEEYIEKYSKIRGKKDIQQSILPNSKFNTVNYMLVDLKRDSLFVSLYNDRLIEIEDESALTLVNAEKPIVEANDKVLAWMPLFARINENNKKTTFPTSGNSRLRNAIKQSAKSLNIDIEIYTDKQFGNLTTEEFNRISLIGLWRREYQEIDFNRMVQYQQPQLQNELTHEGYRYINLVSESSKNTPYFEGRKWSILYRAPICPVTIPFDLLILAVPNYDKTLYFSFYDIKTGKTVFAKRYNAVDINSDARVNNTLYGYYYDLKKGKKLK